MKTILITGTSSGIGLSAAVELARRGERVFASMRDLSRSGPLQEAAAAAGVEVDVVQLDVTDPASVTRAVGEVLSAAGGIDVLVNNAGIAIPGPLEFVTEEETRATFETHVFGPLRVIQAVLPSMRTRGSGRIVNVSSGGSHSRMGHRLLGVYSASKAALNTLSEELLKEVAPLGIEVVLMDGAVVGATSMTRALKAAAAARDVTGSLYGANERMHNATFGVLVPDGLAEITAGFLADACTMEEPPFTYPPSGQDVLKPAIMMSDETFVRLCKLDPSPELYVGLPGFWLASKAVAEDLAAAPA